MTSLKPIRNEEDYQAALGEASLYFDNEPSPEKSQTKRFNKNREKYIQVNVIHK
jgi:antitoxin component HigA of HigAB toxin-antitoxin module